MFYFIHVQGQNALTTLLHLADDLAPRLVARGAMHPQICQKGPLLATKFKNGVFVGG